jgi:hypothetical protein
MSRRQAFRALLLVLLVSSPLLSHAQFQQPAKEELQMTSDPKAPGAAAVYLNYEEVADDTLHYKMVYARIKVLTEKGKDLATVHIASDSSFKVSDVHARTIHSDGSIAPLDVKPEQLLGEKSGETRINRTVFTLPSVEVGSILEYRYQLRYDDNHYSSPHWVIQKPYFVHKAHYSFKPFGPFQPGSTQAYSGNLADERDEAIRSLIWWPVLPQGVQIKAEPGMGHFVVDMQDVPPVPEEAWMPPMWSTLYQVLFYYKSAFDSKDFWNTEAKRWSKEVDHFAEPSGAIKTAVASLVAPADSDLDKAKKLYKAVQGLENTDFTRQKGRGEMKQLGLRQAKRAEDTWAQKSGSRQDIALLYLAMLRAAGLAAWDMKVVNRDSALFAPQYLSWNQFDDDIVILNTGGKDIYLDPGEKMCPFQVVHWKHTAAGGIRQGAEGRSAGNTPLQPYTTNTVIRTGDIDVDEHGAVVGQFRFVMNGQQALHWRQRALMEDLDELKKQFDRVLQRVFPAGVDAHLDHFLGLENPDVNLMAVIKATGNIGAATSKRLMLPGFFFESDGRRTFVDEEKRITPVDMHYSETVTDQVTYHFSPTMQVEGAPQDAKLPWEGQAVLSVKVVSKPGEITVARQLARGFTFIRAEDYKDLRGYYQKLAQNDEQQVVLTTTAATAQKAN